jgi:hypothetical protein
MWMIELATNTITAESKIGSHKAVRETIVPPVSRKWARDVPAQNLQERTLAYQTRSNLRMTLLDWRKS